MAKNLRDWQIDLAMIKAQLSQINRLIIEFHQKRERLEHAEEEVKKRFLEHGDEI